jgi:hypothetical protein
MSNEFTSDSAASDLHRLESGDAWGALITDVPTHLEQLPDGREALVSGDPERCKQFNHHQGDNSLNYPSDCGLVSCEDILQQFGVEVSEDDVVRHASDNWECSTQGDPKFLGETTIEQQRQVLADYGVFAQVETVESLENLASFVEHGHGVIAEVNAGVLWDDPQSYSTGLQNHAIVITGDARDPETGKLLGFYINDSGRGDSGRFVDVDTMKLAWNAPTGSEPGYCVVTDAVLP